MSVTVQEIDQFIDHLEELREGDVSQIVSINLEVEMLEPQRLTTIGAEPDTCPSCVDGIVNTGVSGFTLTCKVCKGTGQV